MHEKCLEIESTHGCRQSLRWCWLWLVLSGDTGRARVGATHSLPLEIRRTAALLQTVPKRTRRVSKSQAHTVTAKALKRRRFGLRLSDDAGKAGVGAARSHPM